MRHDKLEVAFTLGIIAGATFVGYQFGRMTTPKTCPQVGGAEGGVDGRSWVRADLYLHQRIWNEQEEQEDMSYVIRHCRTPISHNVAFEETVSDTDLKSILAIHRNKLVFTTQAARNRGNPHVLKVWQETGTDGRVILMEDRQFNGHWISNTLKGLLNAKAPDVYAD